MQSNSCPEIADVISAFFRAFDNRRGPPDIDALRRSLLPTATLTKVTGESVSTLSVEAFIEPREKLLSGGLHDFHEWVVEGRTLVSGSSAVHICRYEKQGLLSGERYAGTGVNTFLL